MEYKANVADIAKLRKMTGAGMMDCKKAIEEATGDFDRAQEIIREKGKLIAAKRSDRTASEGIVLAKVVGTKAYMLALACETDFVAKGDNFTSLANEIFELAITNDIADSETLKTTKMGDHTVEERATELSGKTGEKIEISCYTRIEAPLCAYYVHSNNKLGTLIGFNKAIEAEVAHDVAMQAAAMAPVSISRDDCPAEILEQEYKIGMEQAKLDGKPENMLERIAEGKVGKFLKENTLLNQALVKDNKITVDQHIKNSDKDATVTVYKRFSLND